MPDLYATIADIPEETQKMLGDALTIRANEDQMREMRQRYFGWLDLPEGGRGLEIGSGTGHVTADLLQSTCLQEAVGLDPSPVLVQTASELFGQEENISFIQGDARATGLPDEHFDLIVFHTSLCHIPQPEKALQEAFRLLKPGATLVVFDGDYAANTAALGENDPLQACMDHAAAHLIHDKWLCRSLPNKLRDAGFEIVRRDAHPYLAKDDAAYFLTLIMRGADFLANDGLVSEDVAETLKAEAQARVSNGTFFGFISFNSVFATRPG